MSKKATEFQRKAMSRMYRGKEIFKPLNTGWTDNMDFAFAEGDRLGVPVILETDAKSKCSKYIHLGMELVGVRDIGEFGKLYDLIRYPESSNENGTA